MDPTSTKPSQPRAFGIALLIVLTMAALLLTVGVAALFSDTPTANAAKQPTRTPVPTATVCGSCPTATPTALPMATNTPLPTTTNTPAPAATNTPAPAATNTPLPTATNTPGPAPTSTPTPAQSNYGVTGDSRTVTEPSFPSTMCAVLLAQQSATALNQTLFDTARIQNAINACPVGQAVELSASGSNNAYLTQPITLNAGVTLLIDAEVTLFGSTNQSDYNCDPTTNWCTPLITVATNAAPNPGSAIMGYGIIDGQGSGWWPVGDPRPRLVQLGTHATNTSADGFTAYKITLQNSAKMTLMGIGNNVTVWGVKISNPDNSPNTDGIDPSASTNWTITRSYVSDGDDHIAIKAGVAHVSNLTISNNHFYSGHGISIGSETNAGANNILVTDNVLDQNGCSGCSSSNDVRIKSDISRGGEVKDILYRNLCIRNASTQPHEFVFDPNYDPSASGNLIPFFHDIHLQNVHMVDAGNDSTFAGYDTGHVLTMTMDNVVFDAYNAHDFTNYVNSNGDVVTRNWNVTLGPGPENFASTLIADAPSDPNVKVTNNISNSNAAYDCTGKFVYLAGELTGKTSSITAGQSVTLTSIVQTIQNPATTPTGTVSILENGSSVASAPRAGRITYVTVPNVSKGTHTYVAHYSGDATYAPLDFGSFTVTAN